MENWDQIDIQKWKEEHSEEYAEMMRQVKEEYDKKLAEKEKALYEVIRKRRSAQG